MKNGTHNGARIVILILALASLGAAGCDGGSALSEATPSPIAGHEEALTVGARLVPTAVPAFANLDDASAQGTAGTLKLSVDAGGQIPRHPDAFIQSVPVFGYGWVDAATGRGIVAVIHPLIGRDSKQNPDGWHTHPVALSAGSAFAFCIASIGRSQGGIAINGDDLRLNISKRWADFSADELDVAAAFVVRPDGGCSTSGLGVDVIDTEALG